MYELILDLESRSEKTLYEQIYEHIKNEIQSGHIRSKERLPSTRRLAELLGVSRSTVQLSYEQLLSEGYIEAVPYRGYFANQVEELYHLKSETERTCSKGEPEKPCLSYDFTPDGIDLEHFPAAVWRKLNKEVLQEESRELFLLGDEKGEPELRKAVSSYLYQARGVRAHPSQILVGAGNDYLLMILSGILGRNQKVAMESPTYRHAYEVLKRLGYSCCTVSMDRLGMEVEALEKSGARIAYVMPSHQYPMGTVMPIGRRQELLQWAEKEEGRYIIEDDHDSEFRYVGKPIPALQGSDRKGKVIYLGTFSKSIAPGIRISYLVLPESLLERYEKTGRSFSCTVSRLDQKVLQLFMERGHFERHLNRMRALYKDKQEIFLEEVKAWRDVRCILGERAGVHLLVEFERRMSEQERVRTALEKGIRIYPLSEYCIDRQPEFPTVLFGYAALGTDEIREAMRLLTEVWQ